MRAVSSLWTCSNRLSVIRKHFDAAAGFAGINYRQQTCKMDIKTVLDMEDMKRDVPNGSSSGPAVWLWPNSLEDLCLGQFGPRFTSHIPPSTGEMGSADTL